MATRARKRRRPPAPATPSFMRLSACPRTAIPAHTRQTIGKLVDRYFYFVYCNSKVNKIKDLFFPAIQVYRIVGALDLNTVS